MDKIDEVDIELSIAYCRLIMEKLVNHARRGEHGISSMNSSNHQAISIKSSTHHMI